MNAPTLTAALAATLALTMAGTAAAKETPPGQPLGQHLSACAQAHLGQRPDPPALTCDHDGHPHTFATFGEMVRHMQQNH